MVYHTIPGKNEGWLATLGRFDDFALWHDLNARVQFPTLKHQPQKTYHLWVAAIVPVGYRQE